MRELNISVEYAPLPLWMQIYVWVVVGIMAIELGVVGLEAWVYFHG